MDAAIGEFWNSGAWEARTHLLTQAKNESTANSRLPMNNACLRANLLGSVAGFLVHFSRRAALGPKIAHVQAPLGLARTLGAHAKNPAFPRFPFTTANFIHSTPSIDHIPARLTNAARFITTEKISSSPLGYFYTPA